MTNELRRFFCICVVSAKRNIDVMAGIVFTHSLSFLLLMMSSNWNWNFIFVID